MDTGSTNSYGWNRYLRYAVAPVTVALALGCRMALNPYLNDASPFTYFYFSIIVSSWLGGLGPGLVATVLSLFVADYFYLEPLYTILGGGLKENIQAVSFLSLGTVVSAIVAHMRREKWRDQQATRKALSSEAEARQMEARLRDTERRLTDIIEFLPDATFALDNAGRIIAWNKAMESLTGAPTTDVLGKGNHEHTYRLYGKRIPCLADVVLSGDKTELSFINLRLERDIVKADTYIPQLKPGGVWLSIKVAPMYDAQGNIAGVIDSCRDITERKLAEEALRESEQRYATLFDKMDEGFCIIEVIFDENEKPIDYRFLETNPAFEKQTDLIGAQNKRMRELLPLHEEYWFEIYGKIALTGEPMRFQLRAEQLHRWYDVYAFRIGQPENRQVAILFNDINERKRIEKELKQYAERLADADRRKDEFMAVLAHELRNPLAPIRYAVQVLKTNGLEQEQIQNQHGVIDRQISHMGRLLDDLLDVSRITRGKIDLKREIVDLRTIADHALDSLRPMIEGRGQYLMYEAPSSPLLVNGDPTRLEQIIRNLLHNANKYTEAGGCIKLSLGLDIDHEQEWRAVVRVIDSGIGIPPEVLPHVFEAFVQAKQALARTQGGLGIGLSMVLSLVQMHGGSVEAHSAGQGKGSEFVVRLPLTSEALREAGPTPEEARDVPLRERRRVLVVDDNEDSAASLGELLSLWGHEIQTAHDGRHALAAARRWQPEVILLDIGLPGMDGYEVARHLREEPATSGAFLVALTGYGQEEDRRLAREAGFDRHLTKPVELDQLQSIFEETKGAMFG